MNSDQRMLVRWSVVAYVMAGLHIAGGLYSFVAAIVGFEPSSHEMGLPVVLLGVVYIFMGRWARREAMDGHTPHN